MKETKVISMKSTVLFLILLVVFSSCNRDNDTNQFYLRFKVDGVQKEYINNSISVKYSYLKSRNKHVLMNLSGNNTGDKATSTEELFIGLDATLFGGNANWIGTDLKAGTYNSSGETGIVDEYYILAPMFLSNGDWSLPGSNDFSITYTQIDKSTAKGTFSGFIGGGISGSRKEITNGEFYVKVNYVETDK